MFINIPAALKKQSTIKDKAENGVSAPVEEKLVKPSAAKQADQATKPADEKPRFTKSALKSALKSEDKGNDKVDRPPLRSVRTIDDKAKEKSVTIVDKRPEKNGPTKGNSTVNDKPDSKNTVSSKDTKPATKIVNDKPAPKTAAEKTAPKAPEKVGIKPIEKVETKQAPTKVEAKPAVTKAEPKPTVTEKAVEKSESTEMATKPPTSKVLLILNNLIKMLLSFICYNRFT